MAVFFIEAGAAQGEYKGATAAEALEAFAQDAGYSSYMQMTGKAPEVSDVDACIELDTDALCSAVSDKAGVPVFADSYGSGVALVGDKSFQSYQDLAEAFDLRCWDFRA
jgi:hypothetical protein